MERTSFEARRQAFGAAAEDYDRSRPEYPSQAVAWMVGDEPRKVVDLGAGTGIFSRLLASLGHEVTAVEPDGQMRRRLAERSPGVTALAGSAESIPLESGAADAVVAAQAYHWFDNDAARAEIARVLAPGGVFAPIWNVRDEAAAAWVAQIRWILEPGTGTSAHAHVQQFREFGPLFAPAERAEFRHSVSYTADSLFAFARTRSAYLIAAEPERRRVESELRVLVRDLPEPFEIPYLATAFRAARL
jgi:SAM-dependent methyltransferase